MGDSMSTPENSIDKYACDVNDMKDGEMREVVMEEDGNKKVLLVRSDGEYFAMGPKCTHFGAPLVKGSLRNGHVRCPWHGACFNIKTGDIEDYPGLDCVPSYKVSIQDGNKVYIRAEKEALKSHKRVKQMVCPTNVEGEPHFLVIGGGPASVTCVETLRQKSFTGKITIATMESHVPYDRTKLSKAMDIDPAKIYLRPPQFYEDINVNIQKNKEATSLNTESQLVTFSDGEKIKYDKLLIATGGRPRTLPNIPGWKELKNVFVLRTPDDGKAIAELAAGKNVVICGASFIGMEVASCLVGKAKKVQICEFFSVPFERVLGKEVGMFLQGMHEKKGVEFYMNASMTEIQGDDGAVQRVLLKDGSVLEADLVVAGVGVIPSTDFVKDAGLSLTKHGFINTDAHLRVMNTDSDEVLPNVYAAGDVATWPAFFRSNEPVNVQHWQMAHYLGKVAGTNMVVDDGNLKTVHSIPFFWTVQYGKSLRYTGYGVGFDDIVMVGDVSEGKFAAYYTKGDDVIALATLMMDPLAADVAQRMLDGEVLKKKDITPTQ